MVLFIVSLTYILESMHSHKNWRKGLKLTNRMFFWLTFQLVLQLGGTAKVLNQQLEAK